VPEAIAKQSSSGVAEPRSRPSPTGEEARTVNEAIGRLVARLLDDAPSDPRETVPLRDLLQTMATEGTRVLPHTECVISVVPAARPEVFQVVAASGPWAERLIGEEWPLHEGMLHGRAMLRRVPVETVNAPEESAAPEVFGRHIRRGRLVPMATGMPLPDGRVGMGVVGFWRPESRPFTDTERAIMDRFTRLISIVVVGDEARESTQRLVDRLRLTSEATRELSSSLEPSRVVQAIVERIAELVDVDRITVTKFQADSMEAIAGYDRTRVPARIGARWDLTPQLRAAIDGGEVAFEGFSDITGMPPDMQEQLSDVRTRVILPLRTGGRVLGILAVSRRTDQGFAQLDLDNLEQIALSAALALQNASLFAETKEAQQKALHALLSVSDHLDATSSDVDLYARFAGTVAALVGARRVTLWRLSTDGRRLIPAAGAHGVTATDVERWRAVPCDPGGRSHRDRVVFADAVFRGRAAELGMGVQVREGAHSAADTMAVAWRAGSLRLGVLAAHEPIKPDGFSHEDAWTLQLAAFAAGLVWQIKASEERIRALGDAEAQRLHEHIERTRSMEKMRSDFLKLASHELRGPIAVVRGYFSMMADGSLDEDGLERAMPVIERKLNDMNALVNEMLETARLEEGVTRLERQPQSLRVILVAATSATQSQLGAHHRLDVRLPSRTVLVDVDAGRIETILRNLLDNAVKFSPHGGEISCHTKVMHGIASVAVIDRGLGIPPEQMHRLFTRFSRLVTPENSHISGTGLGLYLSRELARLHGGDITARSTPGGGASFVLTLPVWNAEPGATATIA
jgi:signal transduction histidine kinase/GAF domain-containing protein